MNVKIEDAIMIIQVLKYLDEQPSENGWSFEIEQTLKSPEKAFKVHILLCLGQRFL